MISIFFLTLTVASTKSLSLTLSDECKVSSDVEFFDLTAFTVEPYVPSLDENGIPYLKGADLANAETNHYRKQYESAPIVRLSMDRYASLTANSADAFKNFENGQLLSIECNELKLFFWEFSGKSVVTTLPTQMFEAKRRTQGIESFVEQRVRLKPKNINDILKVLKSDLAFDPTLIKSTLNNDFLDSLNLTGNSHYALGGELALLSFAKKGGLASFTNNKVEMSSLPEKRGLTDDDKLLFYCQTVLHFCKPDHRFLS